MKKGIIGWVTALLLAAMLCPVTVFAVPRQVTPDYKVAFYPYDCYHMQDENGKRTGYGYEMMQGLAKYLQCTFTYVGYDKSAQECVEMLRSGELDIYTAAKRTPEREAEFAFTSHPAITSYTCMNVKVGNRRLVPGDYSTYNGIRVGLLRRHTYNDRFLEFVKEKGFECEIVYYDTPTELSNALVSDDVDALVNSYIHIPEDEASIENFGETPYYIMARKEDQELIDRLDYAFDSMNVETPNWRTDLYNKYYGAMSTNLELTEAEQTLLQELTWWGEPIRAVVNPEHKPYSWYENGEARGIVPEIFKATAQELKLPYEIIPVSTREEYEAVIESGEVDIWMDMDSSFADKSGAKYKLTMPYLSTTMSVLRNRGASDKIECLAVQEDTVTIREIAAAYWPDARILETGSLADCRRAVLSGEADAALLMSYAAQKLSGDDMQNRFRVDIVPEVSVSLQMGVNARAAVSFYGLWNKTLARVSENMGAEVVQGYLEQSVSPTVMEYLFAHPVVILLLFFFAFSFLLILSLYVQSVRSKKKQEKISQQLAAALSAAEEANRAKQDFFSKMSHDIRTPLNVVLGMTQIAQKYKDDSIKLDNALNHITQEGNYLLQLINSILDVNQLEHGAVELLQEAFNPATCLRESAAMLEPLAAKKQQSVQLTCDCEDRVVRGDDNRLKQILINIISNAIKYTPDGGHIALRMECLPDNRYRFTCQDDGIGMSREFVEHICEDFSRAEDSRVSKIQGTGLGMSVVKGFTELMGGKLTIDSTLGKGSVFTVELPFQKASDEEREAVLRSYLPREEQEKMPYAGKKALLVEDNALNAEIAMELLKILGFSVDWTENGKLGVERFEASRPGEYSVIFMDMQMPVMDGVAAAEEIRRSTRPDSQIPIFAMTANTFAGDRKRCREAGMDGYIAKPLSIKSIEDALSEGRLA